MPTIVVALPDEEPQVITLEPPAPQIVVQLPPEVVTIVTGLQGPPGAPGADGAPGAPGTSIPTSAVVGAYLANLGGGDVEWRTAIEAPIVIDAGLL